MTAVPDRLRVLVEKARQRLLEVEACMVAMDDLIREGTDDLTSPHQQFFQLWQNATAGTPLEPKPPKHKPTLTPARIAKIKTRLTERPLQEWKTIFARLLASRFCCGQNDTGWTPDLDWIIKNKDNGLKVLEGKYDNRHGPAIPQNRLPESVRTLLDHDDPYDPNA